MTINRESELFCVDGKSYRQRWGTKFRLEPATERPGSLRVPNRGEVLFSRAQVPKNSIVVCERSGGRREFLRWLQGGSGKTKWRVFELEEGCGELVKWEGAKEKEQLRLAIDRTRRDIASSEKNRDTQLARIARIIESDEWQRGPGQLLCLTRDIHELANDQVYSSLVDRGHVYRLPHFTIGELENWVESLLLQHDKESSPPDVRSLAEIAKEWTGGQPMLTHLFFSMADEALESSPDAIDQVLETSGKQLRSRKPNVVNRWQEQLTRLVERSPTVKKRLTDYTFGAKRGLDDTSFDEYDAHLFLTGWVGEISDGRWGIKSRCHQQWAAEALREKM